MSVERRAYAPDVALMAPLDVTDSGLSPDARVMPLAVKAVRLRGMKALDGKA